jgi:Phospholipase_D-nuclease N-terminal
MLTGLLAFAGVAGLLGTLCFIFWLWMLIECLRNKHLQGTEKLIWVLVIIFLPVLGSLLYLIIVHEKSTA